MTRRDSRSATELLLCQLTPPEWRDALLGDLQEKAATRSTYWREIAVALIGIILNTLQSDLKEKLMSPIGAATRRPVAFAVALGVLGGSALIATTMLSSRGPLIVIPYAALVIVAALFLRAEVVQPLSRRFSVTLGAFMIATVILYLFIGIFAAHSLTTIPLMGHLWRLGVMLGIGAVLSAAVAQVTATAT